MGLGFGLGFGLGLGLERQRRAEGGGGELVVEACESVGRLDMEARAHLDRAGQEREARRLDADHRHVQRARRAYAGAHALDELGVGVRDQDDVAWPGSGSGSGLG